MMIMQIIKEPSFPAKVERLRVSRVFSAFEQEHFPVSARNIIVARALYPHIAELAKMTSVKRNDGSIEVTAELDILKL